MGMSTTRRQFMMRAGLACAGLAVARASAGAVAGAKRSRSGYSSILSASRGEELPGMIRKAAEIGFSGVEFAGYGPYGDKPAELRKLLDDAGLKAFGTHTGYNLVQPDKIQQTIDFHKAIERYTSLCRGSIPSRWRSRTTASRSPRS